MYYRQDQPVLDVGHQQVSHRFNVGLDGHRILRIHPFQLFGEYLPPAAQVLLVQLPDLVRELEVLVGKRSAQTARMVLHV
ncbi:MAG: hypothetical protein GWP58_06710, partial [Gammaproteobacteria bacterium]|nr:hypothetical protein [Gammaproteobacteria bacterium]